MALIIKKSWVERMAGNRVECALIAFISTAFILLSPIDCECYEETSETSIKSTGEVIVEGIPINPDRFIDWVQMGDERIIELFLKNGMDINAKNKGGWTALMSATVANKKDLVKFLLKKGADTEVRFRNGKTALMLAIQRCSMPLDELLIDCGANINTQDDYGYSPLIEYVTRNNVKMVDIVLSKGADIDLVDKNGLTALGHAKKRKNEALIKKLEDLVNQRKNNTNINKRPY